MLWLVNVEVAIVLLLLLPTISVALAATAFVLHNHTFNTSCLMDLYWACNTWTTCCATCRERKLTTGCIHVNTQSATTVTQLNATCSWLSTQAFLVVFGPQMTVNLPLVLSLTGGLIRLGSPVSANGDVKVIASAPAVFDSDLNPPSTVVQVFGMGEYPNCATRARVSAPETQQAEVSAPETLQIKASTPGIQQVNTLVETPQVEAPVPVSEAQQVDVSVPATAQHA